MIHKENFEAFSRVIPKTKIESVAKCYPQLELQKLTTELGVLYTRDDFKEVEGFLNMLAWLLSNGLNTIFSETIKLLKIIVTTTMTTAESERCFSTLKRVKTYLRNSMSEDRLNALVMMAINKDLYMNIPDFDDKVIEKFISQKDRRMDFVFKK